MADLTENDEIHLRRRGSFGVIPPTFSEQKPSLNLVLCGRSGAGKSAAAQSILCRAELPAAISPGQCVKHQGEVCGRWVSLVELPALSGKPLEAVMQQCLSCISLCGPEGVHAFILVLPVGPLTDEDKAEIEMIKDAFSSRVRDFTVVLFTVDSDPTAPAVAIEEDVQELCQSFRGGYLIFNTRGQQQVSELFDYVEMLRAKNKPHSYTTETLVQRHIEKISALRKELEIQKSMIRNYDLENSGTRRIVLLGKTGSGKSSLANAIFGEPVFKSDFSVRSVTYSCQKAEAKVAGHKVSVVDTPGFFDTTMSDREFKKEILNCISLSAPGPHAFLLVVKIGRITREESEIIKHIDKLFGKEARRFTMVAFTHGDELEHCGVSIEQFVSENPSLKKLISECGNRYHVVNNREMKDRRQVTELMKKIEDLVEENRGEYYTNEMLQEADVAIHREMERIMKETVEDMKRESREMQRKHQQEMEEIQHKMDKQMKEAIEIKLRESRRQMEQEREEWEKERKEWWPKWTKEDEEIFFCP